MNARSSNLRISKFDIRNFPVLVIFRLCRCLLPFLFIFFRGGEGISGEERQRPLPAAKMRDRSVMGRSKKGVLVGVRVRVRVRVRV